MDLITNSTRILELLLNLYLILKCKMKLVHRRDKELIALCIQPQYREDLTKLLHYKVESLNIATLNLDLILGS